MAAVAALLALGGCAHPPTARLATSGSDLSCRQRAAGTDAAPLWISPADQANRTKLSRWCETVGGVVFQPNPSPYSGTPVDRLAIVSWNIHEGAGDVAQLIERLRRGDFTGGEPVHAFVLLLQEVTRRDASVPQRLGRGVPAPRRIGQRRESGLADVRWFIDEGYAVLYAPSMRNGGDGSPPEDRGNAVVSTLPLRAPRLVELPLEHQRRVAVAASVAGLTPAASSGDLQVVDVHFDTALALFRGGPFAARQRQAAALLDALQSSRDGGGGDAMVLGGDLNTWMGDGEPAVTLLRTVFGAASSPGVGPTWTGPLGVHATLDHLFVRGVRSSTAVTRLPHRFGSDHYPLLTVVRVP